jgi:16S rRNA (uracil1498-N3)-methyltransferase
MHRFYLPPEQCRDSVLRLEDREAHHALHVLRLRPGERVTVLDGQGTEYLCEVQSADRKQLQLAVVEKTTTPPRPPGSLSCKRSPREKSLSPSSRRQPN